MTFVKCKGTSKMPKNQAELYKQYNHWQQEMGKHLLGQASFAPNQQLLDVGCGTGELTCLLAEKILPFGQIHGIDPDDARLRLAQVNQPQTVKNITWHSSAIENFNAVPAGSIDLIYSNYAMHWVTEKTRALANLNRLLKPSGIFLMNCIAQYSSLIIDLENMPGKSTTHVFDKYPLVNKADWLALLKVHGFEVISTKTGNDCIFDSVDDFLIFWEATTQGRFARYMLNNDHYHFLLHKYPGKIALFGEETLSIVASKK